MKDVASIPWPMPALDGAQQGLSRGHRRVLDNVIQDEEEFKKLYEDAWKRIDDQAALLPDEPGEAMSEADFKAVMQEARELKAAARAVSDNEEVHAAIQWLGHDAFRAFEDRHASAYSTGHAYYARGVRRLWQDTLAKARELCSEGVLHSAIVGSSSEVDDIWRNYTAAAESLAQLAGPEAHNQAYRSGA